MARSPGFIDGPDEFLELSDNERTERTAAFSVIGQARRYNTTVESTAASLGVPMNHVRWWAGEALGPTVDRVTFATERDDLFRVRPIGLDGEMTFVGLLDSDRADEAQRIFITQYDYAAGYASVKDLRKLPATFAGRRVIRDPRELDRLARAGQFSIEELYRELVG